MDISNQDGDMPMPMPMPINSTYGHHMIHHHEPPPPPPPQPQPQNHIVPNSVSPIPSNGPMDQDHHVPYKKLVKYKECLKNHAASMGGNATDGCGEFMPSGDEGTLEALTCSACNCHRNFHRKETEGESDHHLLHHHHHNNNHPNSSCDFYPHINRGGMGRKLLLGHHFGTPQYPTTPGTLIPSRTPPPQQMLMSSYNMMGSVPSESDDQEDGNNNNNNPNGVGIIARPPHLLKKRFRTKFSQEQKEKMLSFAEKVGWKIQKQEESVVQQFCQEIGVKRRVLKVWMHNNKHNLAKKNPINSISPNVQNQIN